MMLRVDVTQAQLESIEDERIRSAVTYSMITAIQERCRLAESPDGISDNQLMTQVKKGRCSDLLNVAVAATSGNSQFDLAPMHLHLAIRR